MQFLNSTIAIGQRLRTGVWYGDTPLDLEFPPGWDILGYWPDTPSPLSRDQLALALERPVGCKPIRELCRNAKRPLIVIDDVNRPTPVATVLPLVLQHFLEAGIDAHQVTILLATGTHALPQDDSVLSKVGPEAGSQCRILVHSRTQPVRHVGRTSLGTPVYVNQEVLKSDFVLGIGGIYPNHTAGYGGGSKLALGVLGYRSILALHYFHRSLGRAQTGGRNIFREDLDEIAQMLRFQTMISLQSNAARQPVRIVCGDYRAYFSEERAFAERTFSVPSPGDADVVISNAYPCDVSLTFAFMKGAAPLHQCSLQASRILIASCPEGVGGHGLFPNIDVPRFHNVQNYVRFGLVRPAAFIQKVGSALARRARRRVTALKPSVRHTWHHPVHLYVPQDHSFSLPGNLPGVNVVHSWTEVLECIQREQGGSRALRVAIYPCAPLLSLAAPVQ